MRIHLIGLLLGVVLGSAVVFSAGAVFADAPTPVGPHRHYIFAADGSKVYVGPNFCDIEASEQGFAGFHWKVHQTDPGLVEVESEGC